MESLLEQQRRLHEESDRLTDAMRKENMSKKTTLREQINADQKTRFLLDRKMEVAHKLLELYDDRDGLRREEVQAIAGPDEFKEFYKRLTDVKDFHRKHPDEVFVPMSVEFAELDTNRDNPNDEVNNLVEFTDEESYGRFLDLHRQHMLYLNLKGATMFNYVQYLDHFDKVFEFPRDKKNNTYKIYVDDLLAYLISYIDRVNPLLDLQAEYAKIKESFDRQWSKNEFPGWGKEAGSAMAHIGAHLDVSVFTSSEELASLGLDRLKSALMALGLKCGGTLEERAARLYSTKGKDLSELDPALFSKTKGAKGKKSQAVVTRERATAFVEAQIYHLVEMVGEQRQATRENVQRRQARTDTEREDDEDEAASESDSDDNDDEIIYNPKNLPLGWDGKPIPYWLYKLHGLNINYSCEICGNQVYRGPKAFQRHFSEWRHAHGMRCLGIPNTAHFANVTKIEDAMALWSKIKEMKLQERWNPDHEEEFEDSAGNVVSKKTYEDLKRQGLL